MSHISTHTVQQAMKLAQTLTDGQSEVITLTKDEAIQAIEGCATMKSCNWLTGQAAVAVLKKSKTYGDDAVVTVVPGIGVCE